MDYKVKIKERLGKLLFLEMNKDGFKENIGIPSYVTFKNKDLYLPISSEYISSNINDEIKIKNLPIYYFIEGMFIAIGSDEKLRFNDDYELILDYIKDNTKNCDVVDKLIANHLKNIDKQIASLNKLKLDLQKVVSSCGSKKSLSQCKVLKHLSDCVEFK